MERGGAVLIAGPTASGKSALAMRVAERLGGIVINADSMAVYRDLTILTGRPEAADLARVPHRLYGHRDAAEAYSVGLWLAEIESELGHARAAGALPVVVGGTGLFFKALTQGLSDIPAVPDDIRARVRAKAEGVEPEILHARLAAVDPLTASRLRPSDPQRIVRALEVFAATGQPLAEFQARRTPPLVPVTSGVVAVALSPDRALLREAIDRRFDRMMEQGAIDEVRRLRYRGLDPALPAMRALGVPSLLAHLAGDLSLDAAVARSKAETRAYAKRQETFARHQLPGFGTVAPQEGEAVLIDQLVR
ncbi:MAG: tRNA (adenosine(37)-N6)-dimethylallyltransferase MiaA [Janthinobacterium lividum]